MNHLSIKIAQYPFINAHEGIYNAFNAIVKTF